MPAKMMMCKQIQTTPTLSFAHLETKCYCCGKKGHKYLQCKHQNTIPKSKDKSTICS